VFKGTFDGNGFTISGIYVNSQSDYQGLFAKSNGTVKNLGVIASYVKGRSDVGGLVGDNTLSSVINNSYSTVKVTGGEYDIGGLLGKNSSISDGTSGMVNNSYYNKETSGQNDKGKGDGKTTKEMKQKETFKGWDFDNVWKIDARVNDGYPYLY
jgi:hypothetical protein